MSGRQLDGDRCLGIWSPLGLLAGALVEAMSDMAGHFCRDE